VVYPAAEVVAPGVIRHEHGRKFPIGEPSGMRTSRLERLHDAFTAAGLDAPIRDDIRDEIWLKLWGNLCFNPVSALTCAQTLPTRRATNSAARRSSGRCVAMPRNRSGTTRSPGAAARASASKPGRPASSALSPSCIPAATCQVRA